MFVCDVQTGIITHFDIDKAKEHSFIISSSFGHLGLDGPRERAGMFSNSEPSFELYPLPHLFSGDAEFLEAAAAPQPISGTRKSLEPPERTTLNVLGAAAFQKGAF